MALYFQWRFLEAAVMNTRHVRRLESIHRLRVPRDTKKVLERPSDMWKVVLKRGDTSA